MIIGVIVAIAAILSLASYVSYNYTVNNISNSAINQIHVASQVEASDMSNLVAAKLELVVDNLRMLSDAPAVLAQNISGAQILFEEAQNSTQNFTHDYAWINATGTALTSANLTNMATIKQENLTFGQRPYFLGAMTSGALYFSTNLVSTVSHIPSIYIAQPLYVDKVVNGLSTKVFNGIISASISLPSIGQYVESQLSSHSQGSLGLVDPNGVILYTKNASLIGINVLGNEFQSSLPASVKQPLDNMLNQSLEGKSGISDFSFNDTQSTFAYQPVILPVSNQGYEFAILFITQPDVLASTQSSEIGFLGEVTVFTLIGIVTASLVASIIVIRWNRDLNDRVKEKTAELVSANVQLEQQNKTQRDIINIAAHELRTPTQTILTNIEIIEDILSPSEPIKDASIQTVSNQSLFEKSDSNPPESSEIITSDLRGLVSSTRRNANRLAVLTQHILEVAKIDNNALMLQVVRFDLNQTIREAIEDVRASFLFDPFGVDISKIKILFEPSSPTFFIEADVTKVYEVITNFLSNALRHSGDSAGPIEISWEKSGDQVIVKVRDEGTGIDPDILPRLFNKFVTKEGTGLGLYISKGYVEAQGGKVWAENNSSGKGATFYMSLPLVRH